jgi:integrase
MATKKRSAGGWRDGVKKLGPGKYAVRLTWTVDGKRHDTERAVDADSFGDARSVREKLLREKADPGAQGRTVNDALDRFLERIQKKSTRQAWTSRSKLIRAKFGSLRLGAVKTMDVQKFLQELPHSDTSVANVRTLFLSLFKDAKEHGEYGGANPVRETVRRKSKQTAAERMEILESPPQRAYLGDEAQRFLAELSEDLRPMQALQLLLGCRFGEVSALEWRDINMETGEVTIKRNQYGGVVDVPKSGKGRRTAVGPYGLALLHAHRARMAELCWPSWETLVFPRPLIEGFDRGHDYWHYDTVRRQIVKAQKAIGSSAISRTHAMRHTHITMAEVRRQMDVDRQLSDGAAHREMTGHATERQRSQYVDDRALQAPRIAAEIEALIVPKDPE